MTTTASTATAPATTTDGASSVPRRRFDSANAVDLALLVGLTLAGLLHPSPAIWYRDLAIGFAAIAGPVLLGAWMTTLVAARSGTRIQGIRVRPALVLRGVRDTARAAWIAATLLAWPLAQLHTGQPVGLAFTLEQAGGSLWRVLGSTVVGLFVMDAWLYWKHRLLHTRLLFPFHRDHHVYRDPTAFAGFAVGPVESLMTFWPILLLCIPAATHWVPVYVGLVVAFICLNFYLHCGITYGVLERLLPRLHVNTSAFHNVHHSDASRHFGEAFTLWDAICKTGDRVPDRAIDRAPGKAPRERKRARPPATGAADQLPRTLSAGSASGA